MAYSINELLNLPNAEKMQIALQIWTSIPEGEKVFELSPDQLNDLKARRAKHATNPNRGEPWKTAEAEIRADLAKRNNN